MDHVPDNYDLYERYEAEQERRKRYNKWIEHKWDDDEYFEAEDADGRY